MNKKWFHFGLCFAAGFIFLLSFYSKVLQSPNHFLFSSEDDGIKNYFTFSSFISNNFSNTNFEGFNYPYGESIIYTDGHPLLGVLFKNLKSTFPFLDEKSIGIINFLMLFSFILGILFLYLIFCRLKIPPTFSCIAAFGIMVLAPQLFRMGGHFALSYSFFLPLTIYLLLKFSQSSTVFNGVLVGINSIVWFFIHAYLGMIASSFVLIYLFFDFFFIKNKTSILFKLSFSFLPILAFYGITKAFDIHQNRPNNPYGFFEYYADLDTIILPNHPPLQSFLLKFLPNFTQTWEGWSYLGFGSLLFVPILLFLGFKKRFLKPIYWKRNHTNMVLFFFSAFLLLLFSFGIPFRFGLEKLLDYFPVLKQFRAIGRFAWPFYFVFNMIVYYGCFQIISNRFNQKITLLAFIFIATTQLIEGIPYHQSMSKKISVSSNSFDWNQLQKEEQELFNKIEANKYQAIIPLPYYMKGTENYDREATSKVYFISMIASYHLNIPLTNSYLTRTSLPESMNNLQLIAPSFYPKFIKKDIPNKKPFLLLFTKEQLKNDETNLLNRSKFLFENNNIAFYEIEYNSLFKHTVEDELKQITNQLNNLKKIDNYYTTDSLAFFYENFSTLLTTKKSELFIEKTDTNFIDRISISNAKTEDKFVASIWLKRENPYFGQDDLNSLKFVLLEKNEKGVLINKMEEVVSSSSYLMHNWTRCEMLFSLTDNKNSIELYIIGNQKNEKKIEVSNLFIHKSSVSYFQIIDSNQSKITSINKNNHFLINGLVEL